MQCLFFISDHNCQCTHEVFELLIIDVIEVCYDVT